ncbi:hypothetical protein BH09BAC3_BH09BAC3_26620 [soil metagenome]
MLLRWLTLVVILLNIAFNGLYTKLFPGATIQDVSRGFRDLFTPAGYVFSIWGLIYLSFIVYGIAQLLPSTKASNIYDRISVPMIVANILGSAWIMAFVNNYILISLIILAITLTISIIMLVMAGKEVSLGTASRWLSFPFSLFCGWISVATIANAAVTLKSFGWDGGLYGPEIWTIGMIALASLLAIIVDLRLNNYLYVVVIVWATVGIWDERQLDHPNIGLASLVSATVILLFAMGHALVRYLNNQPNLDLIHESTKT